jgi:sugar phosphate isomerase/epimerase
MTADRDSWDCVAGTGTVDWESALAACREVGVKVGVIEMDVPPGDPLDSVEMCLRFFESRA